MAIETRRPELLCPAGDMERLMAVLQYGADAVYLGGEQFNMRAAPENFSDENLKKAVSMCHEKGTAVHYIMNTLPRNDELSKLPSFFEKAKDAGVDAFIVADLGVMKCAQKYAPDVPIHISTQAGTVNYITANAFYDLGAKRVIMAREVSLSEIAEIRANTPKDLEIECFVHGAMCMSFSGRCLLSNYLTGRDANRGDCAQPCRWKYHLVEEKRPGQYFEVSDSEEGTYIMNSRDMCMIEHIPELVAAGVDSFKIEGRAKSAYYAAAVTNAYRAAIDGYLKNPSPDYKPEQWMIDEMRKISYRDYCTGFYFGKPNEDANIYYDGIYIREWDIIANVLESDGEFLTVIQRNRFFEGDELEVLMPSTKPFTIKVTEMYNDKGERINVAPNPMATVKIRSDKTIPQGAVLRKMRDE
ncbi:MAG: U32 family peptidase [Oscillospiraceae bacterium]|nr:U32 family peptidase [Oscillospiraceae bacterium]